MFDMDLPKNNASYASKEYWDKRYDKEENFEWCKSYGDLKDLICMHVKKNDSILILGCGNSTLSEEMYNDGYHNIVNIDFSPVVIKNMKMKCEHLDKMNWLVMDITNMTFPPRSFDVVLEKATLDALLVKERDPWNPSQETRQRMNFVLSQVSRILHDEGRFISVTFSQPHFRKPYLAKSSYGWSISLYTLGDLFHYFFYVMEKGKPLSDNDKKLEMSVKPQTIKNRAVCKLAEDKEDFLLNIAL